MKSPGLSPSLALSSHLGRAQEASLQSPETLAVWVINLSIPSWGMCGIIIRGPWHCLIGTPGQTAIGWKKSQESRVPGICRKGQQWAAGYNLRTQPLTRRKHEFTHHPGRESKTPALSGTWYRGSSRPLVPCFPPHSLGPGGHTKVSEMNEEGESERRGSVQIPFPNWRFPTALRPVRKCLSLLMGDGRWDAHVDSSL